MWLECCFSRQTSLFNWISHKRRKLSNFKICDSSFPKPRPYFLSKVSFFFLEKSDDVDWKLNFVLIFSAWVPVRTAASERAGQPQSGPNAAEQPWQDRPETWTQRGQRAEESGGQADRTQAAIAIPVQCSNHHPQSALRPVLSHRFTSRRQWYGRATFFPCLSVWACIFVCRDVAGNYFLRNNFWNGHKSSISLLKLKAVFVALPFPAAWTSQNDTVFDD